MKTATEWLPFWMGSVLLGFPLVIWMLFVTPSSGFSSRIYLLAHSYQQNYESDYYTYTPKSDFKGYRDDEYYIIEITAAENWDKVKVVVEDADIEPRFLGECLDKVTVYDGLSNSGSVLGEFCGRETPTFESSGRSLILEFKSNNFNPREFRGFRISYSAILVETESSTDSLPGGAIAAGAIICVVLYCIVFFVFYRRCKYNQRMRRELAANGLTPEDSRLAMVPMTNQASRGPSPQSQNSHRVGPPRPSAANSNNSSSRHTGQHGRRGRVRHPAGDVRNQDSHHRLYSSNSSLRQQHRMDHHVDSDDACSGYGSDTEERNHPPSRRVGSGTMSRNSQNHSQTSVTYPPDASGVYYAGDIDEHGILHPPGNQNFQFPVAPTPSVASSAHAHSHLSSYLEDDRRSRGSSRSHRSGHGSERNSPRDLRAGRASPYRHRGNVNSHSPQTAGYLDTEGQTLTYYGMIDNVELGGTENRSSTNNVDPQLTVPPPVYDPDTMPAPPPSYEEAATGKYSLSPNN